MTQEQINELRKLAQAATPGAWVVNDDPLVNEGAPHLMTEDGYAIADFWGNESSLGLKGNERNADYIAAANPAAILELIQQRDELLAHIPEWHCKTCNTIHLPPNGFNLCCPTPKCTGLLKPSSQAIRIVEAQRDELLAALKALDRGCRDPRCIGVLHGLDLARTAIAKAEG